MKRLMIAALILILDAAYAEPTWERNEPIPEGGRSNLYSFSDSEWSETIRRGKVHALVYPVEITGSLLPYKPIENFLNSPSVDPIKEFMRSISAAFSKIRTFSEAMSWLGLHSYPEDAGMPNSEIPLPEGMHVGEAMGLSRRKVDDSVGFTISCAACHVGELFGRPVLGLTNRFPRANALFLRGKTVTSLVSSRFFAWVTDATEGERLMYKRTSYNIKFVEGKRPATLGLDTSLAQVALSLAHRLRDSIATKDITKAYNPDSDRLKWFTADSKPAVWWNLKYKDRWLSDGSVVSGNPIITNLLWNELGRGSDLVELNSWLSANEQVVKDLTTAVFATEAPRITDFFAVEKINIVAAKRGEIIFQRNCARCHGTYQKGWSIDASARAIDQLKTIKVVYQSPTPVIDVGTDSQRKDGMESLLRLNELKISQDHNVKIEMQKGYVPPPLVGIWARWPYFHNNSAPNLCAVLTRGAERPETYWAGEAHDKEVDFDFACNGYPTEAATPADWKIDKSYLFDTGKSGLGKLGHDERIFLKNGVEILSSAEKHDLIQFLQTL